MDRQAIETLINNIENSTLNDAEEIFNDIMDLKAGETISARREEIAAGVFNTDDQDLEEFEETDGTDEI
jgi:hypothetical protein